MTKWSVMIGEGSGEPQEGPSRRMGGRGGRVVVSRVGKDKNLPAGRTLIR